jgi:ribonuclease P protein component
MITQAHRFHGRSSLRFVYQRGQNIRGQELSLRYVLNTRIPRYRVAVVVSRKVSKSAVVRNRIRRRIYEIIRNAASGITEPYDLVFTVYSETAATLAHGALKTVILSSLEKAGALQSTSGNRSDHAIVDKKETTRNV